VIAVISTTTSEFCQRSDLNSALAFDFPETLILRAQRPQPNLDSQSGP
jgi:hypothetical protein